MAAKKLRIGAGLATHTRFTFKADGISEDITFTGASGPSIEVASSGIGLTYTATTNKDNYKNRYSTKTIGLSFSLTIPSR